MALKDDLKTAMQSCADSSGDLDLRAAFGAPGSRILVRGETEDTGQTYTIPGYIECLFEAIGSVIGSAANFHEELFSGLSGSQSIALSANPKVNANALSGYAIQGVYVDHGRAVYNASPGSHLQYSFTAPNLINLVSLLPGYSIVVVYFS